jgi:hypothetical protein
VKVDYDSAGVDVPEDVEEVRAGDLVDFIPFSEFGLFSR